jgi:hypothetical protein
MYRPWPCRQISWDRLAVQGAPAKKAPAGAKGQSPRAAQNPSILAYIFACFTKKTKGYCKKKKLHYLIVLILKQDATGKYEETVWLKPTEMI